MIPRGLELFILQQVADTYDLTENKDRPRPSLLPRTEADRQRQAAELELCDCLGIHHSALYLDPLTVTTDLPRAPMVERPSLALQ